MHLSDIQWDSEQHSIKAGQTLIPLTSTEYRLLFPLRSGAPMSYADLAWTAYHCKVDSRVRTMMDKHIDRIRAKLRGTGVYVYCILGYGYLLLPELAPEEQFEGGQAQGRTTGFEGGQAQGRVPMKCWL